MIRKDLRVKHSLESQPVIKRILLKNQIICIDVDTSMIVYDLGPHQITNRCKLFVFTMLAVLEKVLDQLIGDREILSCDVVVGPKVIFEIRVVLLDFAGEELFVIWHFSSDPNLMDFVLH